MWFIYTNKHPTQPMSIRQIVHVYSRIVRTEPMPSNVLLLKNLGQVDFMQGKWVTFLLALQGKWPNKVNVEPCSIDYVSPPQHINYFLNFKINTHNIDIYIYTFFFCFFSFIHGLCMCMCIYIYVYVHVCMSVYLCTYLYVSLLMYIFMCECIYMYIHKL